MDFNNFGQMLSDLGQSPEFARNIQGAFGRPDLMTQMAIANGTPEVLLQKQQYDAQLAAAAAEEQKAQRQAEVMSRVTEWAQGKEPSAILSQLLRMGVKPTEAVAITKQLNQQPKLVTGTDAMGNPILIDKATGQYTLATLAGTAPAGGMGEPPLGDGQANNVTPVIPPEFRGNPNATQKYLESLAKAGGAAAGESTKKAEGAARFEIALKDMENQIQALDDAGNIVSTENAPLENLGLSISNSGIGRTIGGWLGTERATNFETAENIKPRIIAALAQATGQSSKSLDSNTELKLALDSLGSPSASKETRLNAINTIRAMYANPDLLNQQTAPQQPSMPTGDSAGGSSGGWGIRRID